MRRFNVYEYVHCKYIPIYIQQDATLRSLFISGNYSTRFGWYFHPSSRAHTPVSTAFGICHTVTAIFRYRERVGTGLSVLWVAYAYVSFHLPDYTVNIMPRKAVKFNFPQLVIPKWQKRKLGRQFELLAVEAWINV
jgi:hypothetical protein